MQGGRFAFCMPLTRRGAAILLLGGDKTGNDRWYEENVPKADKLYDVHVEQLKREGKIRYG